MISSNETDMWEVTVPINRQQLVLQVAKLALKVRQTNTQSWQTLRHLSCQRGRDGDEAEVPAAVVDRHLATSAEILNVRVALVAKLLQGESAVHQDACERSQPPATAATTAATTTAATTAAATTAAATTTAATTETRGQERKEKNTNVSVHHQRDS